MENGRLIVTMNSRAYLLFSIRAKEKWELIFPEPIYAKIDSNTI